ncbi:MAG TPA: YihY/virulence factor BrkB family protein [Devosia sp.]|nr:YihY/virulence factor BrkB family protein [Devosia sp.]
MTVAQFEDSHLRRHGQLADSPTAMGLLGWRDVAVRVFNEVMEDRVLLVAAGATYYMLIALVPALTLVVSLYGLFSDPADVPRQMSLLTGILPPGALQIVNDQLTRLTATGRPTLGLTLVISLVVALWSANAGVGSLFDAMNIAYDEAEKRNFFVRTLVSLAFTLVLAIAGIVFLGIVLVIPVVMQFLYLPGGLGWVVKIVSYVLMLILLMAGIGALYRWGPSRRVAKWRWVVPGAVFAAIGIAIVSVVFSWYAANFSNYNATYGSLGALIGLLTWMWLSNTVVITGAELNSELEHQTARDTTTGRPKPLGRRGAYMADHVATVGRGAPADGKGQPGFGRQAGDNYWMVALGLLALLALASVQPAHDNQAALKRARR